MSTKRRDFIKSFALAAGGVLAGSYSVSAKKQGFQGNNLQGMPRRILGKTGERLSVIGLGGMVLKGMTAAVPPSNEGLYKLAVILGPRVRKINPGETKKLEKISKSLSPIFEA